MKNSLVGVNAVGDLIRKSVGFQVFQFDCFLFCFVLFCFFTFRDRVSLCSFGACSGTHSVDQAEFAEIHLPLLLSVGIKGMRHHCLACLIGFNVNVYFFFRQGFTT